MREIAPVSYVDVDGLRLHYERSAKPDAQRPTIVLVHGFGASHQSWHDVFGAVARENPVIRLDLKGFGFSDKPDDDRYSPHDQALLLTGFISKLPDKEVIIVGHSYGGGVVLLSYFRLREDRKDIPSVVGLVLIDAAVLPQRYPFFINNLRNPLTRFAAEQFTTPEWRYRYVLQRVFAARGRVTQARVHRYAFFMRLTGAAKAMSQAALQLALEDGHALAVRLKEVNVPVLIVWGEKDPVIPLDSGRSLARKLPMAELRVLPGTGHVPHEERPEETMEILAPFFRRLGR